MPENEYCQMLQARQWLRFDNSAAGTQVSLITLNCASAMKGKNDIAVAFRLRGAGCPASIYDCF
jgi:hypothetical protein